MHRNELMYFWYRLTRVSGKSPTKHTFYACTGTDSETVGRFDDSIQRVGFATVYDGQSKQKVFELYKTHILHDAEQDGFTNNIITVIGKREYEAFRRKELREKEEFEDLFQSTPYEKKRARK